MTKIENLPAELRETGLFCCWRYEQRGDKRTKVPFNPRTGGRAQSTNPDTFAPLPVAAKAAEHYDGLGVGVFGNLGAIDIDHCVDENSGLSDMAADVIEIMQGYTEDSPSGRGLRILFKATDFQYDKTRYYINNQQAGLEVYIAGCTNKFVTVTGNAWSPGRDLEERGEELAVVLEKYMVRPQAKAQPASPVELDDQALIEKARASKNGAQFAALWSGDVSGYASHSEADMSLCNWLAWWTNRDAQRVDRLFRQSGLMREKWDRRQSGSTYGAITVQNAVAAVRQGYNPQAISCEKQTTNREIYTESDAFLSCFKTLDTFEEEEATWLVPSWIPEGQITLMAADGGIGKTTIWCNMIASISSGRRCILDPPNHTRPAQKVAFLTTEDSVRKKLKKKLRLAGANMANIITPDFLADKEGALRGLKFGTYEMESFIRHFHPALCVFDPVQGFIPPDINMGSRNAMRDCMAPLISLGEENGTTFIVVCHTNKRKGAWGRDRIADSADLWDVSRSVLMAGYTEDQGVRYLSNEKNNYTTLQETLLFTIDSEGRVKAEGTSWKRDREYTLESAASVAAPKREDCKDWLLNELDRAGGVLPSKDLESNAKAAGYSFHTLRRAKDELKSDRVIKYVQVGGAKDKIWYIQRAGEPIELPQSTPVPWE